MNDFIVKHIYGIQAMKNIQQQTLLHIASFVPIIHSNFYCNPYIYLIQAITH